MEKEDGEEKCEETGVTVESLKEELQKCKQELASLQKQLQMAKQLQKNTADYNEELRKQIDQRNAELHERKKRDKNRVHSATQTDEVEWTQTDYYNYYMSYNQNPMDGDPQEGSAEGVAAADTTQAEQVSTVNDSAQVSGQLDPTVTASVEAEDVSIADMLRVTAERAMTQTGFVFDETTGMYYDHSTHFYYDSTTQLYYDNNTGIYYYYDADSGRYQFHSRIEVPVAAETPEGPSQTKTSGEKKGKKLKKGSKKTLSQDDELEEEEYEWVEVPTSKSSQESRKQKRRSYSADEVPRKKDSSSKKRKKNSHDKNGKSKKKKKSKSKKHTKKKSPVQGETSASEREEGEITEVDSELDSTFSESSSTSTLEESSHSEMETENLEVWPPCVRVTVVRSPVLQVGTLFIITADSPATVGREKDMDHAIRIPELGVSKFHAEVYFDQDQQSYMIVDQGSQNGTVINGQRILQPKIKSKPYALTHGDEVKMGETVLSFHIHPGTNTCDGCEPGQVLAHIKKNQDESCPVYPKEDKESKRQKELKQMKAKYGIQAEYEDAKALKSLGYKDRAESRRQTVGSEGVFIRDDAPSSVDKEISEGNRGRKLLEKMGWKRGEGLGKDGTGMKDPIELKIRTSQSGLGAGTSMPVDTHSMVASKSQKNWEKARHRYADVCQPDIPPHETPGTSTVRQSKTEDTETT